MDAQICGDGACGLPTGTTNNGEVMVGRLVNKQADRRLDSYLGLTQAYSRDVHA